MAQPDWSTEGSRLRSTLQLSFLGCPSPCHTRGLPLISEFFPLLHLFTHLAMLSLSLHNLFPPPLCFFISCFKTLLKQIPSCLCQVVGIWVSLGSFLPPPQLLAYHIIKHGTFLYSLVSHKMLWSHSCCWGECVCLKMSPARNVPSDSKRTPNTIAVPFEWAPAGP